MLILYICRYTSNLPNISTCTDSHFTLHFFSGLLSDFYRNHSLMFYCFTLPLSVASVFYFYPPTHCPTLSLYFLSLSLFFFLCHFLLFIPHIPNKATNGFFSFVPSITVSERNSRERRGERRNCQQKR